MKKILYYTVEKEVDNTGESLTGIKDVVVYEIVENKPKRFFSLELSNEDNTEKEILSYIDDNGFGDDEFELIML